MPPKTDDEGPLVHFEKAIKLVELLLEHNGCRTDEVAELANLSQSTVDIYLQKLESMGFLLQEQGIYEVGLSFLDYGTQVRSQYAILEAAQAELERLAEETGEVAWLVIEERGQAVYLDFAVGDNGVRTRGRIGKRTHLHYIAAGKAILAHLPKRRVPEIINKHGLPTRTEHTIADSGALFDELQTIQEQGYAVNENEEIKGVRAIGAPVCVDEDVQGAISVAGPITRMNRTDDPIKEMVQDASNVIEVKMVHN